ncbi:glucosamine--fructose-6-phosphate aminotransferase [Anaerohalosphaera lusitana]|uniref:Glutamine--fructose-6-phosphate aminotransferase [isomerizing] n=1 Tax=Anaerohalosphaera lusitana TaxID=1936003 RepID=A0A1U9NMS3_9BACT|nr:sugar isomerase [Anaerohalosphaera lusitana]AQT69221.1 glucosamine--fructose-6-phosphate aminotransferase [Anaerohalosphaera lusitana]
MKNEQKYTQFSLCQEMMDTPGVMRDFKLTDADAVVSAIKSTGKLFLTGEGSSRIFPAKNAITQYMRKGGDLQIMTEGGRQAAEYDLSNWAVFGASNSGSTAEVIMLLNALKGAGHDKLFGLTARENTKLAEMANQTFVLKCGWENAVAATKSVAEQALFYQAIVEAAQGRDISAKLGEVADACQTALTAEIDPTLTEKIANAGTIYFAGRNDGVAEELTLKTNEITRKKSDFLEGTYAVHGIEEVMNADDVVIFINPFDAELEKIKTTLVDGVGLTVIAISDKDTIFPTIKVPHVEGMETYAQLCAGWNILVEVGVKLGINLDKAERARKVGNEFTG